MACEFRLGTDRAPDGPEKVRFIRQYRACWRTYNYYYMYLFYCALDGILYDEYPSTPFLPFQAGAGVEQLLPSHIPPRRLHSARGQYIQS